MDGLDGMEGSEGSCQHLYAPAAWPNMESHQKLRAYLYLNHAKLAESIAKKRKEKKKGMERRKKGKKMRKMWAVGIKAGEGSRRAGEDTCAARPNEWPMKMTRSRMTRSSSMKNVACRMKHGENSGNAMQRGGARACWRAPRRVAWRGDAKNVIGE